ncbi:PREDICTED: BEL1-like homeodomain protein 4 [Nelumbo nucifera]|uniref:BEL1-like homeodomain protein 4 n=2 Tax=Nelumbo nucifera TaxID=4432 RepID=A0A1U8AKQ2_NELNU|nr:PREDICTED: BEL1-like homeodomain protein 4 [Nelumbo nucifera]XP_010262879.1 PREDICTED: BEL1-like homeodomain protein 4 [Nelumbo nucifera]XP_010262880.1 PREDICTED: BEL1-like homeodomain protein 4 [Nelumbo nucifera]XP_010262881.1 PREDICTED: BEL1-like homeodomain protein 4 [Nelumbo nucifera]DAD28516.1 TPA_asm: hypothetical protein HUJ06_029984 [Nelumbo nucifera]
MSEGFDSECFNSTTTNLESSLLGISNFKPESHVAQQSRRDKLRVQHNGSQSHHTQDFSHPLVQLPRDAGLNPDLIQARNVRNCGLLYDPTIVSSEMLNFSMSNHCLLTHKDSLLHEGSGADQSCRPVGTDGSSFVNSSNPTSSNFNPLAKPGDTPNPMYWKGLGSQQSCDWIVSYVNGSTSNACNQTTSLGGAVISGMVKDNSGSASTLYLKPGHGGYPDVQSSLTNRSTELSSQNSQKQYESMQYSSPPFYQNTLQEVVTSSNIENQGFEMASFVQQGVRETGSWVDGGNELALLPVFGSQASASRLNIAGAWAHRPVDGSHQWNSDLGFGINKSSEGNLETIGSDSTLQGLSLSLSSHQPSELHAAQFGERFRSGSLQPRTGIFNGSQDSRSNTSAYSKPLIGNKGYVNSIQGIMNSSAYERRSSGPLGPFTGYATILKSSKFLKPAQQLLDEFCSVTGPKLVKTSEPSEKELGDISMPCDTGDAGNETSVTVRGGNTGGSSSSFYSSIEASGEAAVGSGFYKSYHPEFQRRKAKLLYMQEEVCRRYKQYQEQMQMVVSSFESVAGLSAATPFTALALKNVSRHFHCLKSAISDQLRHITKVLGEDLSSPTNGTTNSRGDTVAPRMKFINHCFQKPKSTGDGLGFLEPQQHVWRPQRGLPERAVAILRAWLFDHFLHPYPTDADKLMLATQTGLTRNQVSNWFINARVRVWKPMVEEIHMLETKGSAEMNLNTGKNEGRPVSSGENVHAGDESSHKLMIEALSEKQSECSGSGPVLNTENGRNPDQWNQGERARIHSQLPSGIDNGLIGFMPYHQNGIDMGGLGAVSLTLGLRHSVEGLQQHQQPQQQQEEHHLMKHFGGQIIHDFAG